MAVTDYLLDQAETDWPKALASWSWLLPAEFTLWLVNRFADLFLVTADGSVHVLDVGVGTLARVAENREDFCNQMDDEAVARDRLLISLVDELTAAGVALGPGQCYGFRTLPVFSGGEYAVENCAPIAVWDYLGACGTIHEQIRDLPDGARVQLAVKE